MAETFLKNAWYCAGWDYEMLWVLDKLIKEEGQAQAAAVPA